MSDGITINWRTIGGVVAVIGVASGFGASMMKIGALQRDVEALKERPNVTERLATLEADMRNLQRSDAAQWGLINRTRSGTRNFLTSPTKPEE